jgi:hypothetical protein
VVSRAQARDHEHAARQLQRDVRRQRLHLPIVWYRAIDGLLERLSKLIALQSPGASRTSDRHHRPGTRRPGTCFAYSR